MSKKLIPVIVFIMVASGSLLAVGMFQHTDKPDAGITETSVCVPKSYQGAMWFEPETRLCWILQRGQLDGMDCITGTPFPPEVEEDEE